MMHGWNRHGWTLIELVIALTILAILLALAYPAYTEQVIKARRADGHALLFEAAQRQQQFFTANNTFTTTIGSGGLGMSTASPEGYYTLSVAVPSGLTIATAYTLTATRVAPQTADTRCGNLTLTHQGSKGNSGGSVAADLCW